MKPRLKIFVLEPIPTLEIGGSVYRSDPLRPTHHIAKRFLYLVSDPDETIEELADKLKATFMELYPHHAKPCIDSIQDEAALDLDRRFLLREVFEDNSLVRMVLTQPTDKDELGNYHAAKALAAREAARKAKARAEGRLVDEDESSDDDLDDDYEEDIIEIRPRRITPTRN
ncbi:Cdc14 phosphatase binding protein N-terminus-domain-containing protein [Yarrowia lipolytica]|nr:Cdc14 phosphatase binding protein N-terminus-domain-containing protein [Yarrowia lipolytica]KAE8174130.1 Cdc14 phosphatase binding protein N-terminus-domain-containing protein [Yarrowia lipolytica]KAJ8051828.1 Cdc14 phosphatase binding protein N-terminus-domain-containing protein [Yarrowia lipolytica]QNP95299.1 Hypothetical protein YALI2_A00298g [Yarrowia lipolytica]RDW28068.1 Cdc14 phosphatase binding protein N-terminus-domain-containing protein [Yarrowia lipolytica]